MDDIKPHQPRRRFPYNAIAYIMSTAAAKTLVNLVDTRGFLASAPDALGKLLDLMDGCYTATPLLVRTVFDVSSVMRVNEVPSEIARLPKAPLKTFHPGE